MADTSEAPGGRRPSLLICAWAPEETGWDPVEDLSGEPWSPTGARTEPLTADAPDVLAEALAARLSDPHCRGLLLVGRTRRGDDFRLQIRAENRTADGARLDESGPGLVRATAPTAELVRALREAGLEARATSEAEDDAGSSLLYRVLAAAPYGMDAPAVALLRAPAHATDPAVRKAVKTAAEALARNLSALPRSRA